MSEFQITSEMPKDIAKGLQDKRYERVGGTVRDRESQQTLAWLREAYDIGEPIVADVLSIAATGSAQANPLNLAISTMQFSLIMKQLNRIEEQLKQVQEVLDIIDYKIDLTFYANFRAALSLATNSFTMASSETRRVSAMQAINRFLEAEHHYANLVEIEITNGSQVAEDYLTTLCLAYVTEVRCYLELEELDTAQQRLHEGLALLKPYFERHIKTLLTSNPAAYLHPSLKDKIDLRRLTKVYQWQNPGMDEVALFELQRENLFELAQHPEKWVKSLPQAIHIPKKSGIFSEKMTIDFAKQFEKIRKIDLSKQLKGWKDALPSMSRGLRDVVSGRQGIYARLPQILESIEGMIENFCRMETYAAEIETIRQVGMSFKDWQQLAPASDMQKDKTGLHFITVPQKADGSN